MNKLYSTGAVENAASNASVSVIVKVLNNRKTDDVNADIKLFSLNGIKEQIACSSLNVPPLSSEYSIFDVIDIVEYEIQIGLDKENNVLVSLWGKDADANLVAAQRFVQNELVEISPEKEESLTQKRMPASRKSRKKRSN